MSRSETAASASTEVQDLRPDHRTGPGAPRAERPRPLLQRTVLKQLQRLTGGELELRLPAGDSVAAGEPTADGLCATVTIRDDRCFRELAFGGSLGAAEAFLQGLWETDDLVALIRIFCRNLEGPDAIDGLWSRWALTAARCVHWLSRNSRRGSRRNIAAHYDLSNDFFALFLDPTMLYSSGIFADEERLIGEESQLTASELESRLQAASIEKIDRACRTLGLTAGDRLMEIGTGWGALAEHAARHYGCHVTTTTISRQQFEYAQVRLQRAGLADRVTLLACDYRDLPARGEQFDHLVSIEMIEAVGHRYLPAYFDVCSRLLKPGGRMLVQAITMPDERYAAYCRSVDFIQKYVFPGGHLPSVGVMRECAERTGRLEQTESREFPLSYALTLRAWRRRFRARLNDVRRLGFDERFVRLWEYYLCYCEAAFLERAVGVGQFVWTRAR